MAFLRLGHWPPIHVISLSLGHPATESYITHPLCQAIETAWKPGIIAPGNRVVSVYAVNTTLFQYQWNATGNAVLPNSSYTSNSPSGDNPPAVLFCAVSDFDGGSRCGIGVVDLSNVTLHAE